MFFCFFYFFCEPSSCYSFVHIFLTSFSKLVPTMPWEEHVWQTSNSPFSLVHYFCQLLKHSDSRTSILSTRTLLTFTVLQCFHFSTTVATILVATMMWKLAIDIPSQLRSLLTKVPLNNHFPIATCSFGVPISDRSKSYTLLAGVSPLYPKLVAFFWWFDPKFCRSNLTILWLKSIVSQVSNVKLKDRITPHVNFFQ